MKKQNKKGFTLVELLVVIAILAILATVSVVGYSSFTKQAKASVASQEMSQVKTILLADWLDGFVGDASDKVAITKVATGYSTTAGADDLKAVFGTDKVAGDSFTGKKYYEEVTSSGSDTVTVGTKYYKQTSDTNAQSGKTYYTYTEAEKYTQDEADLLNADLTGAITSSTSLTSEQATKLNGLSGVSNTTYAANDNANDADVKIYNRSLDGAKTTEDVKTDASVSKVSITAVAKEADENYAYAGKITFNIESNIITSVVYTQGNGYKAIWTISTDAITTEAA